MNININILTKYTCIILHDTSSNQGIFCSCFGVHERIVGEITIGINTKMFSFILSQNTMFQECVKTSVQVSKEVEAVSKKKKTVKIASKR